MKPCPNCKSTETYVADRCGYVICRKCGMTGPVAPAGQDEEAVKLWDVLPRTDEAAEAREARYEEALQRIDNWARAYPVDIFPEPDFKRVHEVLSQAGLSLDQVSAFNMRYVIAGVEKIVTDALGGK